MKKVQLIVPDLLPPPDWAGELLSGLDLPALEALLARGARAAAESATMEAALCRAFGVAGGEPVAAVTVLADGLSQDGYWLRADPVHFLLQRDKIVALPTSGLAPDEAAALVASLNQHFSVDGLTFHVPHPQRWYLRLEAAPGIVTTPVSQVYGRDIRHLLPHGEDALRWHRLTNETQMLLHQHPVNEALEARGLRAVNGVWLWGGGVAGVALSRSFQSVCADDVLAGQFAQLAGLTGHAWPARWQPVEGAQLLVYGGLGEALQAGDWQAWRERMQSLERDYAQPLLAALRRGELARLEIQVLRSGGTALSHTLTPAAAWKLWRRGGLARAAR
jgi:hypothetical protein